MASRRSSPDTSRPGKAAAQPSPNPLAPEAPLVSSPSGSLPNDASVTTLIPPSTAENPLPAEKEPPKGLTVIQAHELLGKLIAQGQGHSHLGVPFDPGFVTMGSTPFMPIVSFSPGLDWDHGRVTARTVGPLAAPSTELTERLRRLDKEQGYTFLTLRRLLRTLESGSVLGPTEVLREAADVLGSILHAGSPLPYVPPVIRSPPPSAAPGGPAQGPIVPPPAASTPTPTVVLLPRRPRGGKPS